MTFADCGPQNLSPQYHFPISMMESRLNRQQANLSAIQDNLNDIQANLNAIQANLSDI